MRAAEQLNDSDCLRTCIACLLDLSPDKVPDFTGIEDWDGIAKEAGGFQRWYLLLQGWLGERGYWFLEVRLDDSTIWQPLPIEAYAILVGNTPSGTPHMMVGKVYGGGFKKVHDPHPAKPGIANVRGICFLIPVDPHVQIRMGEKLESIEKLSSSLLENSGVKRPDMRLISIYTNAREGLNKSTIAG